MSAAQPSSGGGLPARGAGGSTPAVATVIGGLVRACHPGPTVAVTTVATLLAVGTGASLSSAAAVAAAVLVGQLSVGWSNDAHDAEVDRLAERRDKPVVAGVVTARTLWIAACVALVGTVVLSVLAAGWRGGAAHVGAVGLAWVYNLGVARTPLSVVPYLGAFALLPVFVAAAAVPGARAATWAIVAFGLMGAGAHLVNGARDVELDRRIGLDGAVVRLGESAARTVAALLFVAASVAVVVGARDARPLVAWALPAVVIGSLVPALWLGSAAWRFRAVLLAGVALVALLVAASVAGEISLVATA